MAIYCYLYVSKYIINIATINLDYQERESRTRAGLMFGIGRKKLIKVGQQRVSRTRYTIRSRSSLTLTLHFVCEKRTNVRPSVGKHFLQRNTGSLFLTELPASENLVYVEP